ncbi:uracil-DNA glycosylase [Apiospora rasikravindrae]|uniref:Uracil-DNA glycosylase n=1 Tax=Apiospora rasikravindrae TaxID=990691 RepID=A0ABR1RPG8_9PEZI
MSTLKRKAAAATEANKKSKPNASITSFFGAPKPAAANGASSSAAAAAAPEPPALKFDKAKWVASLTPEQKKLLQLEIDTLDFLDREKTQGKKVFPPPEDIYSWSRHTPFHTVKVVILGQDPYHNVNQAHGLAFSVRPPTPTPPSLRNMFIALKKDYPEFVVPAKNAGLLTPWADRGVLMLNTCLTVRAHEANSHANRGWERFTQKVIDLVAARRTRGVVDQKRHLVLKSVHPSPLSAPRGFFDCGHFRKANDWLATRYGAGSEIDWDLTPKKAATALAPAPEAKAEGKAEGKTESKTERKTEGKVEEKAKGKAEEVDEKEKENVVPPPAVVVVGTDEEGEDGSVHEKSELLDKAGENPTVDEEK